MDNSQLFGWYYLAVVNLLTLGLYRWDKYCAVHHRWRISEFTLLLSAAMGGCAGALLGMRLFRHKTRHWKFRIGIPFCLLIWIFLLVGINSPVSADGQCYYVSVSGYDQNRGTMDNPLATLAGAQEKAVSGDTVYIMPGTYKVNSSAEEDELYREVMTFYKSGITYAGYSAKEPPVFDFSAVAPTKRITAFYVMAKASNVIFRNLEVVGVPVGSQKQSECFRIEGNATFECVNCHDNQAIGFYFVRHGTGECYRCDAYDNIGREISLGNIDGFGAHGDGVKFIECRAWNCSDDGFDCINSRGANTFDHCWAFDMKAGGDSNGFKIGGFARRIITSEPPVHTVTSCIAAENDAHGFYANHQPGQAAVWMDNLAYHNRKGNFTMLECQDIANPVDIDGTREVLHGNIACRMNQLDHACCSPENDTDNSWNLLDGAENEAGFYSLDVTQLKAPRRGNGELPEITFMKAKIPG